MITYYRLRLPKRSVMEKADRISPFSKGINHFFCCSGEAYRARTSMSLVSLAHAISVSLQTHVSSIWGRTVGRLLSKMTSSSKDFCHDSILASRSVFYFLTFTRNSHFEICQWDAMLRVMSFAQKEVPKA